jgi:hypothetical protein
MRHFIKGKEITPRNLFDIGIKIDFQSKADEVQVTTDSLLLPREAKTLVNEHIDITGLFEGIPYGVQMDNGINLDYYIDLTDEHLIEDNQVQCRIKLKNNHDDFYDRADGLSFSLINSNIPIPSVKIEYIVLPADKEGLAISSFIAIYSVSIAIAQQAKETSESVKEFSSIDGFGAIISAGLKVVLNAVFFAILVYEATKLWENIKGLLNPPIRKGKANLVVDLINTGCKYLGYTFDSSIFSGDYAKLALMPVPLNDATPSIYDISLSEFNTERLFRGYPTEQDSVYTLGDLISVMESMFNAKTRVFDKVVYFERWDSFKRNTDVKLDSSLNDQSNRTNKYRYDLSRLFKRYYIHYNNDYSDIVTLDNYIHQASEYSLQNNPNSPTASYSTIKGLTQVNIPFSLAYTKKDTNWFEDVYESLKDAFQYVSDGGDEYEDKRGVVMVSQLYYSSTKIFIHDGVGRPLLNSNENLLSTSVLWDKFHYINSPKAGYMRIIRDNIKFPMDSKTFSSIYKNNFISIDGQDCEILNMEYYDEKKYAIISYKEPKQINVNNIEVKKIF